MNRMGVYLISIILAAGSDSDLAFADLSRLPPEQQQVTVYLTTSVVAPEYREILAKECAYVAASLSSKSYLADQLPYAIAGTNLLRLDLAGLGWEKTWAGVVAQHYVPTYRPDLAHAKQVPLVVSGLWFVAALTDPEMTKDAQYKLLYGTPPKTEGDFKRFWQVNDKVDLNFGRIEGSSGVNVQLTRLLENHATAIRTYSWQTFDSKFVAGQTDPLENLVVRPPKHDASELIVGIPKYLGSRFGTLHAFFLSDGKGNRQEKAPADIVTDSTQTRGVEIKNFIGCVGCHSEGLRPPNLDQYREYILSGARIYAYKKADQQEIDRYLDSPIAKELLKNNADFAEGVAMCNGLTPQANSQAFRQMVALWDAPVDLKQAALELHSEPDELKLALGNYSRSGSLSGRLSLLTQNGRISRQQWESNFGLAQKAVHEWSAR